MSCPAAFGGNAIYSVYLFGWVVGELLKSFIYCPLTLSDVVQTARDRQADAYNGEDLQNKFSSETQENRIIALLST